MSLDAQLASIHTYEVDVAAKHLCHTEATDLVIYDRGYSSFRMLALADATKGHFLVRCQSSSFKIAKTMLTGSGQEDIVVTLLAPPVFAANPKNKGLPQTLTVRFVRVTLDNGEYEVLTTSLLDQQKYPTAIFKELYYCRWGIETFYGVLKTRLGLENFSRQSVESIQQDFHAAVFLTGVEAILIGDVEESLKEKAGGQPKKVNRAVSFNAHRPAPPEAEVTDRAVFDLSVCPSCKHTVGDVVDKVEKYQEDIDLAPRNKIVRHYTITRHWCGHCQEYVRPVNTPAQHLRRFGPNVVGYMLYARYRLRLPLLKIQESLSDLHSFTISEGEIQRQLDEARGVFGDQYDLITELIQNAQVVYADESGWRMDGDNWYIWAFVSPEDGAIRYEVADTRGGGIAKEVLGDKADRVIVSDGYAVYDKLPGENQQCWVHLLRVAKAKGGSAGQIYGELCVLYTQLLRVLEKPAKERTEETRQKIIAQLKAIRDKDYNQNKRTGRPLRDPPEPLAPEVQARIAKHFDQLLVCLNHDAVLPENNTAERAIRTQVILRKIFGGNRSPDGAKTHAVNTSVIATAMTQNKGKGFFEVMVPFIREAQEKPKVKASPSG